MVSTENQGQSGIPINTYDFAKSVAAAIADRMTIKVDLVNYGLFADRVAVAVAQQVIKVLDYRAEEKEEASKRAKKAARRKAAKRAAE